MNCFWLVFEGHLIRISTSSAMMLIEVCLQSLSANAGIHWNKPRQFLPPSFQFSVHKFNLDSFDAKQCVQLIYQHQATSDERLILSAKRTESSIIFIWNIFRRGKYLTKYIKETDYAFVQWIFVILKCFVNNKLWVKAAYCWYLSNKIIYMQQWINKCGMQNCYKNALEVSASSEMDYIFCYFVRVWI